MSFLNFIIPVYNVEKYLRECIDSILNQPFKDYEIILVNDGSNDKSPQICDEYASKYDFIKVIHKENGGSSDARNYGIKHATSDYIAFIDSDDYIGEKSLSIIYKTAVMYDMPDLICMECIKFFSNDKVIPMNDGIDDSLMNCINTEKIYEYFANLQKYPASPCTKIIKRKLVIDNNLYFIKGLLCEDLEWTARLFSSAITCVYCSVPYYYYRQSRADSISKTYNRKKIYDVLYIIETGIELGDSFTGNKKNMVYSFMEYCFRYLPFFYNRVPNQEKKEYKKRVKKCEKVLGVRKDKASKIIRFTYKSLGIKMSGRLLNIYLYLRKNFI